MKCIATMIPVWAQRIEVSVTAHRLLVRGLGRSSYPLLPGKSQVPIQAFSPKSKKPIHLQFANARSTERLVEFVREYGPIHGKLQHKMRQREGREITGKENLVVIEDLDAIFCEQQLFRSAVQLVGLLHAKAAEFGKIIRLISHIGRVYPRESIGDKRTVGKIKGLVATLALADVSIPPPLKGPRNRGQQQRAQLDEIRRRLVLGGPIRTKSALEKINEYSKAVLPHAVSAAHGVLCDLFNRFPLRMFPCEAGAIELPSYDREGILPILYFLLRKDYRDRHHLIKVCPVCAETFKSERGDSLCCGRGCYKRYNDRERYLKNKAKAAGKATR